LVAETDFETEVQDSRLSVSPASVWADSELARSDASSGDSARQDVTHATASMNQATFLTKGGVFIVERRFCGLTCYQLQIGVTYHGYRRANRLRDRPCKRLIQRGFLVI
jgi:hypothetical protein